MFPEMFRIGWLAIPSYGVMAAVGLLAALYLVQRLARQQALDPDKAWMLGIIAILSALVGAKILYVLNDWRAVVDNPRRLLSLEMLQAGGVFYGGLLGAIVACLWYVWRAHLPVLKTADIFAPAIALGHTFGRVGCFAAGCCYGRETTLSWGVAFHSAVANRVAGTPLGVHLHPTQIYEFVVELCNFFLLMWVLPRKKFDGQVMGVYLFLYGFARYFIEFFRGDPGRGSMFGGVMTGTQFISILLVLAGGALWVRGPKRQAVATILVEAAR